MTFIPANNLDHLNVPINEDEYFPYANELISRAWFLLKQKTRVHANEAARFMDFMMDSTRVDIDHDVANQCTSAEDAFNFETASDFGEFTILQILFDERFSGTTTSLYSLPEFIFDNKVIAWRKYELAAVVALNTIRSAMQHCDFSNRKDESWIEELDKHSAVNEEVDKEYLRSKFPGLAMREAWRLSLMSVGLIRTAERMREEYVNDLLNIRRQSRKARALNNSKHQETYIAREKVLLEWHSKITDFPSATKAGLYFYTWLSAQGLKAHEPSTITKWIRQAAKAKGIKLR